MTKQILAKVMAGVLSVGLTTAGAVGLNASSTANMAADNEHVVESAGAEEGSVLVYDDNWGERAEKEGALDADVQSAEDEQALLASADMEDSKAQTTDQQAAQAQTVNQQTTQAQTVNQQTETQAQTAAQQAEAQAAEQRAAEQRAAAEQAAAEKAAEQAAAEQAAAEQAAAEKAAAEKAAAEKAAAEQAAAEKAAKEEAERLAREEAERLAAEQAAERKMYSATCQGKESSITLSAPEEQPKVAHYHCNCGHSTTDYNELGQHMFQHALNGDRNSYCTTYE